MYLMTCTRLDLAYPLSLLARYMAPGRHRKELRLLTYLLTDLGEQPRSPPNRYVDNKAMIALWQEHRLEHRTKHIALRYFLARELQQRGQLRLAYVATRANIADIFTKALPPAGANLLLEARKAGAAGGTGADIPGRAHTGGTGAAARVGAGGTGAGAADGIGAGDAGASRAAGPGGAGTGAGGAGLGDTGAVGAGSGDTRQPRLYFVLLLQQVLGLLSSPGLTPPVLCPPPDQLQPPLQPATPLPAPSPYTEQIGGLTERHESGSLRAASPTVPCLPATVVDDPSFESAAACALVAELVDLTAACHLDYAASVVAESKSDCPPSVRGECALSTDVLEDRQEDLECFAAAVPHLVSMLIAPEGYPDPPDIPTPRSYAKAITGPYSSQRQTAMDAEGASWKSTGTYVDIVPPPGENIVDGMWIFRVKRSPGSPCAFKARYVARGFSQRRGVDFFQTFSPTPKMTTLRALLHVAAHRYYELHSLDFSTIFLQGRLHEEIRFPLLGRT
ncbi:unnamed protein product [Closterium sp. NIES-53]